MASRLNRIICILLNIIIMIAAAGILGLLLYCIQKEGTLEYCGTVDDISVTEIISHADMQSSNAPSAVSQTESISMNSNPAHYQKLAETAIAQENFEEAAAILKEGVAATNSEELVLQLEALQLTIQIPEYQRLLLDGLYIALGSGDQEQVEAALEAWSFADHYALVTSETPWFALENALLAWDGTQFLPEYTGIGIAFDGVNIYYGELKNGIPNGTGTCISVDISVPFDDAVLEYLRLDGSWEMGTIVGEGHYYFKNMYRDILNDGQMDGTCKFDGTEQEVITSGELTYSFPDQYGTIHKTTVYIQDNYLSPEGIVESAYFPGIRVFRCDIHSGCSYGVELYCFEEQEIPVLCKNPQPWNRESSYQSFYNSPMLVFTCDD